MPVTNNLLPDVLVTPTEKDVTSKEQDIPTTVPTSDGMHGLGAAESNLLPDVPVTPPEKDVTSKEQVIPTTVPTSDGMHGLSAAERKDPNRINVTISNPKAPLVILFGPPACGKTMTLVRLTRFLQAEGYTAAPIRTFRPASDTNYEEICNKFDETMNSDNAAESTNRINFMLVEVSKKNGGCLCQILEAPGEHYFNPGEPNGSFPNYVNTIINSQNRKVWIIMTEPNWMDQTDRRNYVTKIERLKKKMRPTDNVIFVFNKIDLTNFVRGIGNINKPAAINQVKILYPNIFVPFKNQNPITKWFKEYNCDFVPFQTGDYTSDSTGLLTYQEGPKEYCVKLWNAIMKSIRG